MEERPFHGPGFGPTSRRWQGVQLGFYGGVLATVGLSILLVTGLHHIGGYFDHYGIEYGVHLNTFKANEGAFLLMHGIVGGAAAALLSIGARPWLAGLARRWRALSDVRPVVAVAAGTAFLACVVIRFAVFERAWMVDDEHAYVWGAQILAGGQLTLPGYPEALRPFLANQFLILEDRSYTQYFPGFLGVLAGAEVLGLRDLLNPALAALGVVGTYLLGAELSGSKRIGAGAAALLTLSPAYLFTGATLMSHHVSLCGTVFALWMCARARTRAGLGWAAGAAALFGITLWTRPLSALAVIGVGAWMLSSGPRPVRGRLQNLGVAAAVGALFVAGLLLYQHQLTGSALMTPYEAYRVHSGAFEDIRFTADNLQTGRYLELLVFPLLRYNFWLLGWPCSLFLLAWTPAGPLRRFCLGGTLAIWWVHLPWSSVGVNLAGAAHYLEVVPLLTILVAAGWAAVWAQPYHAVSRAVHGFAVASMVLAATVFFPVITRNLHALAVRNNAPYEAVAQVAQPALVFTPRPLLIPGSWTGFRRNNLPDLSDDILWLNDRGHANDIALALYPDRHAYRIRLVPNDAAPNAFDVVVEPISASGR